LRYVKKVCKFYNYQEDVEIVKHESKEEILLPTSCVFKINKSPKGWIIDSGCTNHMTFQGAQQIKYFQNNNWEWRITSYEKYEEQFHSCIKIIFEVLYIFQITQNLLSVAQILEKCYKVSFENKLYVIKDANDLKVFKVYMKDKRFALDMMKRNWLQMKKIQKNDQNQKKMNISWRSLTSKWRK